MIQNFLQACDYENGYTKALLDVRNWFERNSDFLRLAKMYNKKGINVLLKGMLDNRTTFMDMGEMTVFRITKDDKGNYVKVIAEKDNWK